MLNFFLTLTNTAFYNINAEKAMILYKNIFINFPMKI